MENPERLWATNGSLTGPHAYPNADVARWDRDRMGRESSEWVTEAAEYIRFDIHAAREAASFEAGQMARLEAMPGDRMLSELTEAGVDVERTAKDVRDTLEHVMLKHRLTKAEAALAEVTAERDAAVARAKALRAGIDGVVYAIQENLLRGEGESFKDVAARVLAADDAAGGGS